MARLSKARAEAIYRLLQQYKERKAFLRSLLISKAKVKQDQVKRMALDALEERCQKLGLIEAPPARGQKQALTALLGKK